MTARLAAVLAVAFALAAPSGPAVGAPAGSEAAAGSKASAAADATGDERPILGFHHDGVAPERRLEALLVSLPQADRMERDAHLLTRAPHVAGTPENEAVARYIARSFEEAGLEVELKRYPVYLGYVRRARLEQVEPEPRLLGSAEEPISGDDDTLDERAALNWNAYSTSCDLTREVVYANYGRPEDLDRLERLGVEVKDRILLERYYHGYRGGKVLEARSRGAAAVLFFSDPADDGYVRGDPYPDGPWGPESHLQRGATALDFFVPGDPLTPGWPSRPNGRRIRPEEAASLPRFPSMPISGRDARTILAALRGPVVPAGWQGGLPLTYHVGPGPSRLHLTIDASFETRTITDVIGRLRGSEEPERSIVLGNHHDAWFYGAVDPISGTATMLELARAAGELARRGLRPRRTLVFGNWDAEEFTLTGSTEWGEEFERDLRRNAIACLNVDSTLAGALSASVVPSMRELVSGALRDLQDPATGRDLYTTAAAATDGGESFAALYGASTAMPDSAATSAHETPGGLPGSVSAIGKPPVPAPAVSYGLLGSGSDYTVFFNHLGIPSLDLAFDGPYGVYHSVYDDHLWMTRFGDPGARYQILTAKLWGLLAYRLANADILPFEERPYATDIEAYLADLETSAGRSRETPLPDLTDLRAALAAWKQAAGAVDGARTAAFAGPRPDHKALRLANAALM
ncbi:MAG TPA: M28 family peptidase, partial [Candidatus Polarisedimenticolia bacterium]